MAVVPTEVKFLSAEKVLFFINGDGELVISNGTANANDTFNVPIKELTGIKSEEGLLKFYGRDCKLMREFDTESRKAAVALCRAYVLLKGKNNPGIDKLYVPKPRPAGSGGFRKKNKVPEDEVDDDAKEEEDEAETKKKPAKKPVAPRKPKGKAAPKKPEPVEEDDEDDDDDDDDDDSGDISSDLDSD